MTNKDENELEHYNKGKKALADNDYILAIDEFTQAIKIDPTKSDVFNARGVAYENNGKFDKAINDYASAIKLFPENEDKIVLSVFYSNRATLHLNQSNYSSSIDDYLQAIDLDSSSKIKLKPNLILACMNLFKNGESDDIIKRCTKVIDAKVDDAHIYLQRGIAYADCGNVKEAIDDINKSIEMDPTAEAYYNRGVFNNQNGNFQKALDDYSKAIAINPYSVSSYSNRALLYAEMEKHDKAIEDYNTLIEFGRENADDYNNRGWTYEQNEEYKKALKDYNTAIKLNPNFAYAYNNRGNIYNNHLGGENEEVYEQAVREFSKAIELKPDYAVAFNNLGVSYYKKLVILVNKIRNNHKDGIPNHQEYDALENENYLNAIDNFTQAIKLKPGYKNAYANRGEIYKIKGEQEKANIDFQTAESLPKNRIDSTTKKNQYNIIKEFSITIKDLADADEMSNQFLFKYKTIDTNTLSALNKESIWVASPKTFNDPIDGNYLYDKIQEPRFRDELDGIGVISFEGNKKDDGGLNTLIWSHYADAHKGICLIYKRLSFKDKQANTILKMNYQDDITLLLDSTEDMIKTGFQTKHSSWSYENEYRLILHQKDLGQGHLYKTKDLGLELVGVVFGLECKDKTLIKKILDSQNIKYYKIEQEVKHNVTKHLKLVKKIVT